MVLDCDILKRKFSRRGWPKSSTAFMRLERSRISAWLISLIQGGYQSQDWSTQTVFFCARRESDFRDAGKEGPSKPGRSEKAVDGFRLLYIKGKNSPSWHGQKFELPFYEARKISTVSIVEFSNPGLLSRLRLIYTDCFFVHAASRPAGLPRYCSPPPNAGVARIQLEVSRWMVWAVVIRIFSDAEWKGRHKIHV